MFITHSRTVQINHSQSKRQFGKVGTAKVAYAVAAHLGCAYLVASPCCPYRAFQCQTQLFIDLYRLHLLSKQHTRVAIQRGMQSVCTYG